MKIALLQQDITWGNPADNIKKAELVMNANPGADLYVLPEMFSTGFCTNPAGVAESTDCNTLKWMQTYAIDHHCAVAGSIAIKESRRFYNRFYFVNPDGTMCSYDKKHLFTYGGEHQTFVAGKERVIVEYKGIRILLQICYDLRFPVWARNRNDYDMILYVASWPTPRIEAWLTLLRARAIENQCYVAGVNRVGTDPLCEYCGGTLLIDPYGRTVASCKKGEPDVATANIDIEELIKFRHKFPVLNDADNFTLNI